MKPVDADLNRLAIARETLLAPAGLDESDLLR